MINLEGKIGLATLICLIVTVGGLWACGADSAEPPFDWRSDWALPRNFSLSIDTEGYELPTSIAFVPNPGDGPKDPLYFVTELSGKVKVVTNDRSVFTFAEDFFLLQPVEAFGVSPSLEIGLAGLCLDPSHGYVFVTFPYHDLDDVLRNNIVRFQSKPETFSVGPEAQVAFTQIFSSDRSNVSHQIGPCQITDEMLYVSVGDGEQPHQSQRLDSTLGKILRMTLDGKPVESNPFYQEGDSNSAASYVWAYGLRNPFGLKIVEDRVFVADNGNMIDRFIEVREGQNYLWDGTDRSIATNTIAVLAPGEGVAQLDYYPNGSDVFTAQFGHNFFLTVSGNTIILNRDTPPQILTLEYDLQQSLSLSVPTPFFRYRGNEIQVLPGVGFGPDGLYVVPLFPNREGRSPIYRIAYQPGVEHPFLLERDFNPLILMHERGCFGCHKLKDAPGGDVGPALDTNLLIPRVEARLSSKEYGRAIEEIDLLDREPFVSFREARREVLDAEGLDRVETWLKYRILEPRFDNPDAQMPNLGLSEEEAAAIAAFLAGGEADSTGFIGNIKEDLFPSPARRRHLLYFFIVGFGLGGVAFAGSYFLILRLRRRGTK